MLGTVDKGYRVEAPCFDVSDLELASMDSDKILTAKKAVLMKMTLAALAAEHSSFEEVTEWLKSIVACSPTDLEWASMLGTLLNLEPAHESAHNEPSMSETYFSCSFALLADAICTCLCLLCRNGRLLYSRQYIVSNIVGSHRC